MPAAYLQVFSMTDHAEPLQGRFQGKYRGRNADLHTSQADGNTLTISDRAEGPQGELERESISQARALVAYRHTDTGVLEGTSETLIPVASFPWSELPGFEIRELLPKERMRLKLFNQELTLEVDRVVRIRFLKTVVYLRNFGVMDNLRWSGEPLEYGPAQLHREMVDDDLTLAPPGASGLTVKAGQETAH